MRSLGLGLGLAGVLLGLCAFERPAWADEDEGGESAGPTGVEIGLRTGFGRLFGKGLNDDEDKSSIGGQIPIWLDLGYRITPNIYVGGFFQYGFVLFDAKGCDAEGVSCSAHDIRFGLQGQFHILPNKIFDPWVGVGVGYDILGFSQSVGNVSVSSSLSGFQFVDLALGGDYKVSENFGIGPFVDFSIAKFTSASISSGNDSRSGDIEDSDPHFWLTFGLRGAFDIPVGDKPRYEHKKVAKARESTRDTPDTAEPSSPPPSSSSPPSPPPQVANQKPVSGGEAGAWPAGVPVSERNTCSFVCVPKDGAPPRESDKAALQKSLDKHLGAMRACVGNGKSAAGVVVSFDAIGRGTVGYDFGPRATVRNDCPGSFPPVKNLSGPPNATWKCTDYCE